MGQHGMTPDLHAFVPAWTRRAVGLLPGIRPLARLSLESKFYLAAAFAFASLLLVGTLAIELARGARRHADAVHQSHAVLGQLAVLAADLARLERMERRRFLNGAAAVDKDAYLAAQQDALVSIATLQRLIPADSAWRTDLRVIAEVIEQQWAGITAEVLGFYGAIGHGTASSPAGALVQVPWISAADHIHSVVAMGHTERRELARKKASEDLRIMQMRNATVVVGVVAGILGVLLTGMVRHELTLQGEVADGLARMNDALDAKVQERTSELAAATDLLRKFSAHIEAVREAERLHMARDVHDALGSTLTALKLELSGSPLNGIACTSARARCRRASVQLVDQALQTVEDLVTELRPAVLDKCGLWEALRWKAAHFEERTGIRTSLRMTDSLPEVSMQISTGIFRIVEEALTNVARHAQAAQVEVVVTWADGALQVEISDDGRGIARDDVDSPDSFGLLGMGERARLMSGELCIGDNGGCGTTVRLRMPLWLDSRQLA
jgi:signal transduction histidine kinase